jgi:hypothetical protein
MIVRLMNLLDVPGWLRAIFANKEKNDLAPRMFLYPTLRVVIAEDKGKPLAYLPVHNGLILDSLAWGDEVSPKEKLDAIRSIVDNIVTEAYHSGIRELIYVSSDSRIDETAARSFGFAKVVCYRKVINEPSLDESSDGVERS